MATTDNSQQQEVHKQITAKAAAQKEPEIGTKERALTNEQESFISSNLAAVMAREAPWLTPEQCTWIIQNATSEEVRWAIRNSPGHPPFTEWRNKILEKRLISKNETGDDTVAHVVLHQSISFASDNQVVRGTICRTAEEDAQIFKRSDLWEDISSPRFVRQAFG